MMMIIIAGPWKVPVWGHLNGFNPVLSHDKQPVRTLFSLPFPPSCTINSSVISSSAHVWHSAECNIIHISVSFDIKLSLPLITDKTDVYGFETSPSCSVKVELIWINCVTPTSVCCYHWLLSLSECCAKSWWLFFKTPGVNWQIPFFTFD